MSGIWIYPSTVQANSLEHWMVGRKYFRTLGYEIHFVIHCQALDSGLPVASIVEASFGFRAFSADPVSSWGVYVASMFFNELNFGESCPSKRA